METTLSQIVAFGGGGLSAGSLCWFADAVTGFHGEPRRVEGLRGRGFRRYAGTTSTGAGSVRAVAA